MIPKWMIGSLISSRSFNCCVSFLCFIRSNAIWRRQELPSCSVSLCGISSPQTCVTPVLWERLTLVRQAAQPMGHQCHDFTRSLYFLGGWVQRRKDLGCQLSTKVHSPLCHSHKPLWNPPPHPKDACWTLRGLWEWATGPLTHSSSSLFTSVRLGLSLSTNLSLNPLHKPPVWTLSGRNALV